MSRIPIKALVQTGLNIAFDLCDEIVIACTYKQITTPAYDAATGVVAPTYTTADVSPIFLEFEETEVDGQKVKVGDERLLIKATELGAIVPHEDDVIVETVSGIARQVIAFDKDPSGKLWTFQMRKVVA